MRTISKATTEAKVKKAICPILPLLMLILSACAGQSETTVGVSSTQPATAVALSAATQPTTAAEPSTATGSSIAYTQNGGTETKAGQIYDAAATDESAVHVTGAGSLTLSDSTIASTGNTSSQDNSSFYGLNAAVLAGDGSTINLSYSSVTTSGTGANGVFATGTGSSITLSNVTIVATAGGGHGVMATNAGTLTLTDTDISTAGKNSGAIATDRGGGTITVSGGTVTASGQDSPGIYSTGSIAVTGGTITATGAEAAVIEGANSIFLTDTDLSSSMGNSGSNGGTAILTADGQTLTGNLVADGSSSIDATLQNGSLLAGALNSDHTAQAANLTLDASSTWNVTADSYLTCLADAGGISGTTIANIAGNGHTVTYDASACTALGSQTYPLDGGGYLKPAS
jgi:hypothetical protein